MWRLVLIAIGWLVIVWIIKKLDHQLFENNKKLNKVRVENYFLMDDIFKELKLDNKNDEYEVMKIELLERENERKIKDLYVPVA